MSEPLRNLQRGGALDQPIAGDAPLDSAAVEAKTRIDIIAGTEGQEASISYGDMAKQRWRLLLTAPLDKETEEAKFATLDGLANATRITWEGRRYSIAHTPKERKEADILRPACIKLRAIMADLPTVAAGSALDKFRAELLGDPRLCKTGFFNQAVELADKEAKPLAKDLQALRKQVYGELVKGVWINVLSFKVTGGVRSYDFITIDPTTVSKDSTETDVWSGDLSSAWYLPERRCSQWGFAMGTPRSQRTPQPSARRAQTARR